MKRAPNPSTSRDRSAVSDGLVKVGTLDASAFLRLVEEMFTGAGFPENTSGRRKRLFDAVTTFFLFLRQRLAKISCQDVVAEFAREQDRRHGRKVSVNTSGYCQARARLGKETIMRILQSLVDKLNRWTDLPSLRWCGRNVKVVDATCLTLPDTPANREAFPLSKSVKPGCGFPQLRMVAVFSLATGAMIRYATGSIKRAELNLFGELMGSFEPGDVVLGDRGYCSTAHLFSLIRQGVDAVVRTKDARVRRRVLETFGDGEKLVAWARPERRPAWMNVEKWKEFPKEIIVREIEYEVPGSTSRTKRVKIATTLLDRKQFPARMFAELYHRRWDAELSLRDLKVTLELDRLTCLTPEMVEKEIAIGISGHNLVRDLMMSAAAAHGVAPRKISFHVSAHLFKGVMAGWAMRDTSAPDFDLPSELERLIRIIGRARLRNTRGRRRQPRAIKSRPKFPYLTSPREEYRDVAHRNHAWDRPGKTKIQAA